MLIRDNDGRILFKHDRAIVSSSFIFFFYLLNFFSLLLEQIALDFIHNIIENKICSVFLKTYCTITCNTVRDNEYDFRIRTELQRELKKLGNKDDNILSC